MATNEEIYEKKISSIFYKPRRKDCLELMDDAREDEQEKHKIEMDALLADYETEKQRNFSNDLSSAEKRIAELEKANATWQRENKKLQDEIFEERGKRRRAENHIAELEELVREATLVINPHCSWFRRAKKALNKEGES